jgi:hypothetical protein
MPRRIFNNLQCRYVRYTPSLPSKYDTVRVRASNRLQTAIHSVSGRLGLEPHR